MNHSRYIRTVITFVACICLLFGWILYNSWQANKTAVKTFDENREITIKVGQVAEIELPSRNEQGREWVCKNRDLKDKSNTVVPYMTGWKYAENTETPVQISQIFQYKAFKPGTVEISAVDIVLPNNNIYDTRVFTIHVKP